MKFLPGNAQNIGARSEQQDSFGFSDPADKSFVAHAGIAAVVADGMGGLANGSIASSTAVNAFLEAYGSKEPAETIPDALLRSLQIANHAVVTLRREGVSKDNLGTTLAAVALHEDWLYWVSAGDSRVYFYRQGQIVQLTADHIYAADLEEQVVRGRITREQAISHPERESLTSYLGLEKLPRLDRSVRAFPVKPGDTVLICSDGLYRALSDDEIAGSLEKDALRTCETLVERAMAKQIATQDNITVIALQCRQPSARPSMRAPAYAAILALLMAGGLLFWWRSAPVIGGFAVDRPQIQKGQTAVLRWRVDKGAVTISPGVGRVNRSTGNLSVSPEQRTTYTLTAQNMFRSNRRSVVVDVVSPPKSPPKSLPKTPPEPPPPALRVTMFQADPAVAKAGGPVKLSWIVEGKVSEVRMDGEKVNPIDSLTIPEVRSETAYTLTAIGPAGRVTRNLRVPVAAGQPRIKLFLATPNSINAGESAVLKWSVKDATDIQIDPGRSAGLKPTDTRRVTPSETTTYSLTAAGNGKPVIATVVVKVIPVQKTPVGIASFESDKNEIARGESATLKWHVTGDVLSVSIDQGIGSVNHSDSLDVTPSVKTTYTLTVAGAGGTPVTKTVTIDVREPLSGGPQ
jgi:serine/threonine protein phosphatase PrpC